MTLDHFDVILVIVPPDDEHSVAARMLDDTIRVAFTITRQRVDARFAVIRAGLDMTRKVIG